MTIVGLDDTDSRERGMCTTYLSTEISERFRSVGVHVERQLLVRLNPAVEHKTRGNASLAIHADVDTEWAFEVARNVIDEMAEVDDPLTNPGLVVAPCGPEEVPTAVFEFGRAAVRDHLEIEDARRLLESIGYRYGSWKNGRGLVGALAAVGASAAVADGSDGWTYEHIAYRSPERWGLPRSVDAESVHAVADERYPNVWDTVDRVTEEVVCTPHTPCPVLYGIRGEDPVSVREVANGIESEPVGRTATFLTNQGTDSHLRDGTVGSVNSGSAYRLSGRVAGAPETRRGGHDFFPLEDDDATIECVAFEPTKRFRRIVRKLRAGDRVIVCGEVSDGTLKLEKFAVRELVSSERVTPTCPRCERSMKSAGREQGYRCRDCKTNTSGRVRRPLNRDLEVGWYEVPPAARRHLAKPLVRGGFDGPIHPSTDGQRSHSAPTGATVNRPSAGR